MSLESIVSATPSIEKLPVTAYSPPSPISELPVADEKATLVTPDAPVPRSFFDNEINGQALLERPSNGIFSVTSPPPVRASNGLLSTYTVFCNNCNQAIPDAHYHCSTCQNGDYDLCQTCIDSGVLCGGTDHWLIKRFLQNGNDIRSTTETIAPRKTTRVQESGAGSVKSEAENEIETSTRTCNCCIECKTFLLPTSIQADSKMKRILRVTLLHASSVKTTIFASHVISTSVMVIIPLTASSRFPESPWHKIP
jgi:hypothetical protein